MTDTIDTATTSSRRVRLGWLISVIAFFLMGAGWAIALPINGTYDEKDHIMRAYAVASGQIYADGYKQNIPKSLIPGEINCTWAQRTPEDRPPRPASCQIPAPDDRTLESRVVNAARYSPVYYLPVGMPMAISPTHEGIIVGRLISAALAALLLGSAMAVALWLRNKLLVAAVILVSTPLAMNLNGSINPNGLEIAAGVLLITALLALLRTPEQVLTPRATKWLLSGIAVSGALLMTVRHMGAVLLAIAVAACLALAKRGRVPALLRRLDTRIVIGVVALAGVLAVLWLFTSAVTDIPVDQSRVNIQKTQHMSLADSLRRIVRERVPFYLQQLIGQHSYGETVQPSWLFGAWFMLVSVLMVPAALLASRRFRLTLTALAVALFAILAALELYFLPITGWYSHGRYAMPAGVGMVLMAAFVRRWQTALGPDGVARFLKLVVLITVPLQVWALAEVMTRFQVGPWAQINPFIGYWKPPTGPIVPLAAEVLGLLVLGALAWRAAGRPAAPVPAEKPADKVPALATAREGSTDEPTKS